MNETNFQTTTETAPIESDLAKEAVEPTVRSDTLDSDDDDDFPHYQLPERELHPKIVIFKEFVSEVFFSFAI